MNILLFLILYVYIPAYIGYVASKEKMELMQYVMALVWWLIVTLPVVYVLEMFGVW